MAVQAQTIQAVSDTTSAGDRLLTTMQLATEAVHQAGKTRDVSTIIAFLATFDARLREAIDLHIGVRISAGQAAMLAAAEEPGRPAAATAALRAAAEVFNGAEVPGLQNLPLSRDWTVGVRFSQARKIMSANAAAIDKVVAASMKGGVAIIAAQIAGRTPALGALGSWYNPVSWVEDAADWTAGAVRAGLRSLDPTNGKLWSTVTKLPGAVLTYNPVTLSVRAVAMAGSAAGIDALSYVDNQFGKVDRWAQDHPLQSIAILAAAVGGAVLAAPMLAAVPATITFGTAATAAVSTVGTVSTAVALEQRVENLTNGPPTSQTPKGQLAQQGGPTTTTTPGGGGGGGGPPTTTGGPLPPPPPGQTSVPYDHQHGGAPVATPDGTLVWPDGSSVGPDGTYHPPGTTPHPDTGLVPDVDPRTTVTATSKGVMIFAGLATIGAVMFVATKKKG